MKYTAEIDIMPLKELLDPQGKAVAAGLKKLNLNEVKGVRIGKHITIELEAGSEEEARSKIDEACKKLLANPVMEHYHFSILAN